MPVDLVVDVSPQELERIAASLRPTLPSDLPWNARARVFVAEDRLGEAWCWRVAAARDGGRVDDPPAGPAFRDSRDAARLSQILNRSAVLTGAQHLIPSQVNAEDPPVAPSHSPALLEQQPRPTAQLELFELVPSDPAGRLPETKTAAASVMIAAAESEVCLDRTAPTP